MRIPKNVLRETKLNEPSPEVLALPFYPLLPRDPVGLLRWRVYVRERCLHDLEYRHAIMQMCKQDVLFFISTFVCIHETRLRPRNIPMRLWADQADVAVWIAINLGLQDIVISKSRGIGMSWLTMAILIWVWLFWDQCDIAVVSKDKQSLDLKGRPATLMGKLDYLYEALPAWMKKNSDGKGLLNRTTTDHKFENTETNTCITGFVPTDEKLRSGRFFFVMYDEFAFLDSDEQRLMTAGQYTSFCRIFLSTFNGTGNMFHRLAHDEKSPLYRIRTFWWNNEDRARGLYTAKANRVEILDPSYPYEDGYNFVLDGLLRSPFFDYEMARAGASKQATLEELNGVAAAATRKLYPPDIIKCIRRHIKPCLYRGRLLVDEMRFEEDDECDEWKLWRSPEFVGGALVIGVDPAAGVAGKAYGSMVGLDLETGEQVFTYAGHDLPIDLARKANAAGRFFCGKGQYALLSWETTGIGVTFTNEIYRLKYPRLFENDKKKHGYQNNDQGETILSELGRAYRDGEIIVYDELIADELEGFEYNRDEELEWAGLDGHADRAMSLAICWNAGKARRKALLKKKAEKRKIIGPESEPLIIARKRSSDQWSSQFGLNGYRRS